MEKATAKLAPIISFSTPSNDDPYSDEELLVVNSPTQLPKRKNTNDKECNEMNCIQGHHNNESQANNSLCAPNNLEINFQGARNHSNSYGGATTNIVTKSTPNNALVIGEIPINLSEFYINSNSNNSNNNNNKTNNGTSQKQINNSSQSSFNFIDSPMSSASSLQNRTSIIPYIIFPLTSGIRRLKLETNELMSLKKRKQSASRNNDNETTELEPKETKICDGVLEENANIGGDTGQKREQWARKTEFLLAIIGFSVDLGNVWRFPKVVFENGGGIFFIPYFIQLALCGLPLFYMELALGQFHQTGLFTLWEKICPLFKGLAYTAIIIDIFMAMFYNTVIAWSVYYLFLSFRFELPWKNCNEYWNTHCCLPFNDSLKFQNFSPNVMDYQLNEGGSIVYKINNNLNFQAIKKRIVMFNIKRKEYNNTAYKAIQDFYRWNNVSLSIPNLDSWHSDLKKCVNKTLATLECQFDDWVRSYFLILNGEILEAPKPPIFQADLPKYIHDPMLITEQIEKNIEDTYKNQSVELFLNCEVLNNPTQEFYIRFLTEMHRSTGLDNLGGFKWQLIICLLLVFMTVYFAIWKGIKSAGKAVWITATAPYVVMFVLLIRGLTLPGSEKGIHFYLSVDKWDRLKEMKIWVDAATQIFFSLGPGFGTIIALSSYNKLSNNCYRDALLTSFINCLTSILSGFVVFSTLGNMTWRQGIEISELESPGSGLIFITYPQAISLMPFAPFWAVIFFFMLFTLGIDSTFGGLEAVITAVCDAFPKTVGKRRSLFVLVLTSICFLGALPTVTYGGPYIVTLLDGFTVTPSILVVVFFEILCVMYVYGCDRFCDDIEMMIKSRPNKFWIRCWKYISPIIIMIMMIIVSKEMIITPMEYEKYRYVGLGQVLAGIIVGLPISFIPMYIIYRVFITEGTLEEKFKKLMTSSVPRVRKGVNLVKENGDGSINMESLCNSRCIIVNFNNIIKEPVSL